MRFSKKGSLSISINAIVIIVLAMTFLGLGLMFVRNMFKDIGDTTTQVQEQIKQQILDDLRTGDKKLSFPTTEVKLGSNEEAVITIGVKNTRDFNLDFKIELKQIISGAAVDIDPSTAESSSQGWNGAFFWDSSAGQTLGVGEAQVYGIKYFAPQAQGTYLYKLTITAKNSAGTEEEYVSKTFFVRVI